MLHPSWVKYLCKFSFQKIMICKNTTNWRNSIGIIFDICLLEISWLQFLSKVFPLDLQRSTFRIFRKIFRNTKYEATTRIKREMTGFTYGRIRSRGRNEEAEGRRTTLKGSSLLRESFETFEKEVKLKC